MAHPSDNEAYQKDTIVRITRVGPLYGRFAKIIEPVFLKEGKNFLHYHAHVEGESYKDGQFTALYHDDIELEALPPDVK